MLTKTSQSMIITNGVLLVVSGVAVILRIIARKHKAQPLKVDDHLVVMAWAFSAALAITNIIGVPIGGFGAPIESLSEEKAEVFLKILFVLQFWYIIAVALIKLSVLYFYARVFSTTRVPPMIKFVIVLTLGWLVSFLFATFFQVWPLWCNWIVCYPTTNYPVMYVCSSITDIILDITILCLPAQYIRHLHISRSKKIWLGGMFGLGVFCVISSIIRLVYAVGFVKLNIISSYDDGNYAVNYGHVVVNFIMWSGIETSASVICANLPCYGPLISKIQTLLSNLSPSYSISSIHNRFRKRPWLDRRPSDKSGSSAEVSVTAPVGVETRIGRASPRKTSKTELELGVIEVRSTVGAGYYSSQVERSDPASQQTAYHYHV